MPEQAIDYAALAQRHGGSRVSSAPPDAAEAGALDYAALAREHGGAQADQPDFRTSNERDAQGAPVVSPTPTYPHAALGEAVKGFGKKAAGRAVEFLELIRSAPVVGDAVKSATAYLYEMTPEEQEATFAALHEQLKPSNTAQAYGGMGEQVAEAIVPAMKITKAAGWTASKIGPLLSKYLGKTAGHLLPTAAVESAGAASIAKAQGGDASTGAALGAAFPVAGAALRGVRNVAKGALVNPNAAEREAVEFGLREGVPVDLGTASGNRFVKGVQSLADNSPLGGGIAARAKVSGDEALTRVGGRLADETAPAAITTEQAGEGIRKNLAARIAKLNDDAGEAYDTLRAAEADPKHASKIIRTPEIVKTTSDGRRAVLQPEVSETMGLSVDVKAAKERLRPDYERQMAAKDIAAPMGAEARALIAMDRLMNGPDFAPLSVVDEALSDLKALQRKSGDPALHRKGTAVTAEVVRQLDAQVRARASRAGPDVIKALMQGRAATKSKYAVVEVFEGLKDEPVKTIRSLVAPKDTAVQQLKEIANIAPEELPKIGRAYLDDLLGTATAEGGFAHTQKLSAEWQKLGAETKQLLFQKPGLIKDLDHFFQLARKMGESPNPSGTALVSNAGGQITLAVFRPELGVPMIIGSGTLSKMLHSPKVVRALTRAMQAGNGPQAKTAVQQLLDVSDEAGIVLASQAAQSTERSAASVPGGRR